MFKKRKPFLSVIIAAGGSSSRMNGVNKILLKLDDTPVLCMTVRAFENCEEVNEIIISAKEDLMKEYSDLIKEYGFNKVAKVVKGGKTRLESVYNAILACSSKADYVMVHDAARPFIENEDIKRVYETVKRYGCAAAGRRITDTVKTLEGERIVSTLDRNALAVVQTPQGADKSLLFAALKKAVDDNDPLVTDESSALERIGAKPYLTECSPLNIKITSNEDILLSRALMEMRKDQCV